MYQESELNWALCRVVLWIQSTSSIHTNRNILMIFTSFDIYSNLFLLSRNICTLYSIFLSSHGFCFIFSIMPVVCYHSYVLFYFMSLMTNSFRSISFFFMTLALQNFPGQISKSQNLNDPFVYLHEAPSWGFEQPINCSPLLYLGMAGERQRVILQKTQLHKTTHPHKLWLEDAVCLLVTLK